MIFNNIGFKIAKEESKKSLYKHKVGCAILKGKRKISSGFNKITFKSKGVYKYSNYKNSTHAERLACSKVNKLDLKGASIYVYRQDAKGRPVLAKPCDKCMQLIKDMKFKYVYYTIKESPYYERIKIKEE